MARQFPMVWQSRVIILLADQKSHGLASRGRGQPFGTALMHMQCTWFLLSSVEGALTNHSFSQISQIS
jgi:hypothetical protein